MDPTIILAAGVASGTVFLFAAVGEIFAERAGVLNLGVEGMMLMGAVVAFGTAVGDRESRGSASCSGPWPAAPSPSSTRSSRSASRPSRSSPGWP